MNPINNAILIRKAIIDDYPEICELAGQLGYSVESEEIKSRIEMFLNNPLQEILVAAAGDHCIVGYIHFHQHFSLENEPTVEVGGFIVNKKYQRMGIGKNLLSAAEEWAVARGFSRIRLHSNIIREEAHQFYRAMGFNIVKTQYAFIKNLA